MESALLQLESAFLCAENSRELEKFIKETRKEGKKHPSHLSSKDTYIDTYIETQVLSSFPMCVSYTTT